METKECSILKDFENLQKIQLRLKIKEQLRSLNKDQYKKLNASIQKKILSANSEIQYPFFKNAQDFAFFMPLETEPDIVPIIENYMKTGKNCYLPKVINDKNMKFFLLDNSKTLEEQVELGCFGIREPKIFLPEMNCSCFVIFVPALAFDLKFSRLGKGKGYYDKFLSSFKSKNNSNEISNLYKIGVCYDFQVFDKIPTEKFDIPMNAIVTEKSWIF
ncbi:MAG: 5-formyltetrahydrofolate cyclo-ligase [Treponemataceae bacterium]